MPKSKAQVTGGAADPDTASEALLIALTQRGEDKEKRDTQDDNPFVDEDGDLRVVATLEDLSTLVEGPSVNALPMQEILRRNLRVTLRAIEMAEIAYHANPRQGTSTALTQMQKMAQEFIASIESRQDPDTLKDEIMEAAVKPLVYEFVKVLTSEAERKRATLLTIVPPESANIVQHAMADLLQGVSAGMDDAFDECGRALSELLGSKNKKKK